jgi:enoyl-CoA hydratase
MIEVTGSGDIAILRMCHGKANAMDTELCNTMVGELTKLQSAKAVIITGQGRIFSAGVDLRRALAEGPEYFKTFLPALCRMFETVFFYPKPVIAALNGHAVAGGCVLACAADRRLMGRDAGRMGVTELLVGVPFPVIAIEIVRFVLAPGRFEHAIFSGATFPPEEALAQGFVDTVVEPTELLERAVAAAQALAAISPAAFALSKRQTRQPARDRWEADCPRFDAEIEATWCAPEAFARIADYVARTLKR